MTKTKKGDEECMNLFNEITDAVQNGFHILICPELQHDKKFAVINLIIRRDKKDYVCSSDITLLNRIGDKYIAQEIRKGREFIERSDKNGDLK